MEIGGYFGLELTKGKEQYHATPYRLKSGRSALLFILKELRPSNVYVPYYTCNALLEPFELLGLNYTFYKIDEQLELVDLPKLRDRELLLYVNYYDIKRGYVEWLSDQYEDQLIVDCTQAYFMKGDNKSWLFNSCRKFFGVPDGAFLYIPDGYDLNDQYDVLQPNEDYLTTHLTSRLNGQTEEGYSFFQQNEILNGREMAGMSVLTACLLSNIDYNAAMYRREDNFRYLHNELGATNRLTINLSKDVLPSFYPYLPDATLDKARFWAQKVFVPIFWGDCLKRPDAEDFETEIKLSQQVIPIPVDHRYSPDDLKQVVSILKNI